MLFLTNIYFLGAQEHYVSKDSVQTLVRLSSNFYESGENKKSISLAQQALNLSLTNKYDELLASTYNIIGLNYTEFGDYKKAEEIYLKGLAISVKTNNSLIASFINSNLGTLYQVYFKNHNKAVQYHLESLNYALEKNLDFDILASYLNISIVYYDVLDYSNMYKYLNLSKPYLLKINDDSFFITYHSLLAQYYDYKGDFVSAEKNFKLAEKHCPDKIDNSLINSHAMDLYDDIGYFYERHNKKALGYDYLKKHLALKDTLYSIDKTQTIADYAAKMDVEDFKREASEMERLNDQQQKTIYYSKVVYVLSGVLALFLIVLIVFLFKAQNRKNNLIKEEKRINESLRIAKLKVEELSEAKTQFIGKVSHELRTPLYGIIGLADILNQDFPILRNHVALKSLHFSARYLMNLINDILQLQKIESNTVKIETQNYIVKEEINGLIESLKVLAHKSKNNLSVQYQNLTSEILMLDKLKLNQILFNLLSNALKFTQKGEVTLTINEVVIKDKISELQITVQDNGIGISQENLDYIFDKFTQYNTNGTDYQGTGLGLSIVKQLIHILGGNIKVSSALGEGTTFVFTIPCEQGVDETSFSNQDLFQEIDFNSLQILLIENNEINRLVNERTFANFNIPCTIVSSAKQALDLLEIKTFDIILTDINMPEMDGFEFSKYIRSKGDKTPIIALTAYTREDVNEDLVPAGINDLVTKPFEFRTLIKCIINVLHKQKESTS